MTERGRSLLKWTSTAATLLLVVGMTTGLGLGIGCMWGTPLSVVAGKGANYRSIWVHSGAINIGPTFIVDFGVAEARDPWIETATWWRPDVEWLPRLGPPASKTLVLPLWIPLVMVAGVAYVAWRNDLRVRRRRRKGQCLRCGYDVTTLGMAKCPECGSIAGRVG